MSVRVLDTPSLGDRSYLLTDGHVAVVIDPQRDVERVLEVAEEAAVRITHVLETHVHNDYVTGGLALAKAVGARYVLPRGEDTAFGHDTATDRQVINTGGLRIIALHTPGHTPTHTSYAALLGEHPVGLFTGGSMLYGAVGRTDLIAPQLTRQLTLDQHVSVRRLAEEFGDGVAVYPTHGFGSHCSSGTSEVHRSGGIGDERSRNPALLEPDPEAFADALIAGLHPYPRYYAHMGPLNRVGPTAVSPHLPMLIEPDLLATHLQEGSWVVDLRPRTTFSTQHLAGSVNVELRNDLPTYLGWIIDWDKPLVLLAPDTEALREAQVMLARIGLDELAGAVVGPVEALGAAGPLIGYPRAGWAEVNDARPADATILDVRDGWEWDTGHHSAARHIPFYEVLERADELSPAGPVLVYCATGNRAAVAASQLEGLGRDVVLIDDFCLPGDIPG